MKIKYEAFDGTNFDEVLDCVNYEWREKYPEVRCYRETGERMNVIDNSPFMFLSFGNVDERDFLISALDAMGYFCDYFTSDEEGIALANKDSGYYSLISLDEFKTEDWYDLRTSSELYKLYDEEEKGA